MRLEEHRQAVGLEGWSRHETRGTQAVGLGMRLEEHGWSGHETKGTQAVGLGMRLEEHRRLVWA